MLLLVPPFHSVFLGEAFVRRDINVTWLPQVEAFVRAVAEGALPLWDPGAGFGRPLLADARAGVLYPPTWLNLILRPPDFYALYAFGHLIFAAWGQYLLARRWRLSRPAALLASSTLLLSGPLLSLVCMWHQLAAAAYFPWVLLLGERALHSGHRTDAVAWGGVLALQVLAGSPDTTSIGTACVLLLLGWRQLSSDEPGRQGGARQLGQVALALSLAAGLSAAQWLPTAEAVLASARLDRLGPGDAEWSLHPLALPELVLPATWSELPLSRERVAEVLGGREPFLRSHYLGLLLPCLAVVALTQRWKRALPLLGVTMLLVGLALGSHFGGLLSGLPGFRYVSKALVPAAFVATLLAAHGLDAWAQVGARRRLALATLIASALACGVLCVQVYRWVSVEAPGSPLVSGAAAMARAEPVVWRLGVYALGTALLAALLGNRRVAPERARLALVLASVLDLAVVHAGLEQTAPRAFYGIRPAILDTLPDTRPLRVYVRDYAIPTPGELAAGRFLSPYRVARVPEGWTPWQALTLGVHLYLNPPTAGRWGLDGSFDLDMLGFDPVWVRALAELARELEGTSTFARLLRLGGVDFALSLHDQEATPGLELVATEPGLFENPVRAYAVSDPLPRSYVVSGARRASGADARRLLLDPAFLPHQEIVLPETASRPPDPDFRGTSRILVRRADRVVMEVEASAPAWAVLLERWDPGWRAVVDGESAEVLRANTAFRAVAVGAGRHRVELTYRPSGFLAGSSLSALSLLAALAVWWRERAGQPQAW